MDIHSIAPALRETERLLAWTLADAGLTGLAVVPTIQTSGNRRKARCLGWTTPKPRDGFGTWWTAPDGTVCVEVGLSAESLDRPLVEILGTVVHESCHLIAIHKGIRDVAKGGRHNKLFAGFAEASGLIVKLGSDGKPTDGYGYGYTDVSPELESRLMEQFQPDATAFGLFRNRKVAKVAQPALWGCTGCSQLGPRRGDSESGADRTNNPAVRLLCADCMIPLVVGTVSGIGEDREFVAS